MTRRVMQSFLALLVVVLLIVMARWNREQRCRRALEQLLSGSDEFYLASLEITGQSKSLQIQDPESLQYMTRVLRGASREGYVPSRSGTYYTCVAAIEPAGTVRFGIYVPVEEEGITMALADDSYNSDPICYWVSFAKPVPESIRLTFERLR